MDEVTLRPPRDREAVMFIFPLRRREPLEGLRASTVVWYRMEGLVWNRRAVLGVESCVPSARSVTGKRDRKAGVCKIVQRGWSLIEEAWPGRADGGRYRLAMVPEVIMEYSVDVVNRPESIVKAHCLHRALVVFTCRLQRVSHSLDRRPPATDSPTRICKSVVEQISIVPHKQS
jgi:hypothetical protein